MTKRYLELHFAVYLIALMMGAAIAGACNTTSFEQIPTQTVINLPSQDVVIVVEDPRTILLISSVSGDTISIDDVGTALELPLEGREFAPTWSPDGKYLAFVEESVDETTHRPSYNVYLFDYLEPHLSKVYSFKQVRWPPVGLFWTSDSRYISLVDRISTGDEQCIDQLINIDAVSLQAAIVSQIPCNGFPVPFGWSPSGEFFGYVSEADRFEVSVFDAGTGEVSLLSGVDGTLYASWLPASNALVIEQNDYNVLSTGAIHPLPERIHVFEVPSMIEMLEHEAEFGSRVAWKLDGSAFSFWRNNQICTVEVITRDESCFGVSGMAADLRWPGDKAILAWSPDGDLAFTAQIGEVFRQTILVRDWEGNIRNLNVEGSFSSLVWPLRSSPPTE